MSKHFFHDPLSPSHASSSLLKYASHGPLFFMTIPLPQSHTINLSDDFFHRVGIVLQNFYHIIHHFSTDRILFFVELDQILQIFNFCILRIFLQRVIKRFIGVGSVDGFVNFVARRLVNWKMLTWIIITTTRHVVVNRIVSYLLQIFEIYIYRYR